MEPQRNTTPEANEEGQQGPVIEGHNYDGIKEYDNPMPAWWIWLFWASVIFAPLYMLGVHTFGWINTYEDDLAAGQAEIQAMRDAHAAQTPAFDVAMLSSYVGDAAHIEAGKATYLQFCLPCHGDQGQGLIGPNLTDAYWIHGNSEEDIFNVITNGVVEKGMTPWDAVLSPQQRAQVVAFVRSIEGTNPPNPKEPQGDLIEAPADSLLSSN